MKFVGIPPGLKHRYVAAQDEQSLLISGNKCNVYGFQFEAGAAEVQYLQFFNKATAAEVSGTMEPDFSVMVPASDGVFIPPFAPLHHFDKGCVVRCSKTARNAATAPATDPTISIWYAEA